MSTIVQASMTLWISVGVNDLAAERAIIASNVLIGQLWWTGNLSSVKGTFRSHPLYTCLYYDFPRLYLLPIYPCWHTQVNVPDWFTALPPLKHSSVLTHSRSWLSQSASSAINLILITCMFVSVTYASEFLIRSWELIRAKFWLAKKDVERKESTDFDRVFP